MAPATVTAPSEAPTSVERATENVLRVKHLDRKAAFVARAMNAIAQMASDIDERTLNDIAGARSDYDMLALALARPEIMDELGKVDPLAPARLRWIHDRKRLLDAEGGVISGEQAASLLRMTRQGIDKRRRAGRLIGLNTGVRKYAYPAWQFDTEHGVLPGLERVLAEIACFNPWTQTAFMVNPNIWLDDLSPLDALRAGRVDDVLVAAQMYGEQGAP